MPKQFNLPGGPLSSARTPADNPTPQSDDEDFEHRPRRLTVLERQAMLLPTHVCPYVCPNRNRY